MIIKDFKQVNTSGPSVVAFSTSINLFNLKDIIYPHEETSDQNLITKEVLNSTPIVLGVFFENTEEELIFKDEIYILDGHHRFQYIIKNSIIEDLDVILINIEQVNIDCYNSELLVEKKVFLNKIIKDFQFSTKKMQNNMLIQIDSTDYYSDKLMDIRELYSYKKELMKNKFISPIPNNTDTSKSIIRFSSLSINDFSKAYVFPYKSTWITPRFDN
tara:strand:- start:98 stop:745 length:648 start_codon:yes stop_codon:yes gene_type:complete